MNTCRAISQVMGESLVEAIGLEWVATEDYLSQQHVLAFRKPGSQ
jgi:hypothetical protein